MFGSCDRHFKQSALARGHFDARSSHRVAVCNYVAVRACRLGRQTVKSQPTLMFSDGAFLDAALRNQRLTETEIVSAIRASGHAGAHEVAVGHTGNRRIPEHAGENAHFACKRPKGCNSIISLERIMLLSRLYSLVRGRFKRQTK